MKSLSKVTKTGLVQLIVASVVLVSVIAISSSNAEFLQEGVPPFALGKDSSCECAKGGLSFETLAQELSASVVNIAVETEVEQEQDEEGSPFPPGFPFFNQTPEQLLRSLGSGFIVSSDGYIVTNYHVISKAKKIVVRLLDDKTDYEAKLIGRDDKTDLALIKISPPKGVRLVPVMTGDSDKLEVGEWVLAIGNQFQLGQTVTAGIVSAKSRKVPTKVRSPYDDFIQTDASINPGSSGGPLFNRRGQVVGINTAIFSPNRSQFGGTGFNIGIGFAIPINLARTVLQQLHSTGKVTRGLLGVKVQPIDADLAEALGLKKPYGALVADVVAGSPADKAGFKVKDVIIDYNGNRIREHHELPPLVAETKIGSKVIVKVLRRGELVSISPVITELKAEMFVEDRALERPKANRLGLICQTLTPEIASSIGLPFTKGVVVNNVDPNSPAAKGGVLRGDVIEQIDNRVTPNIETFNRVLEKIETGRPILVFTRRREGTYFLTVKLEETSGN